jgi:hypothetical protein
MFSFNSLFTIPTIVPWLAYSSSCWSAVELQNLGDRGVAVEVEAHKSSGALAPLVGRSGIQVRLNAGEQAEYKLQLPRRPPARGCGCVRRFRRRSSRQFWR